MGQRIWRVLVTLALVLGGVGCGSTADAQTTVPTRIVVEDGSRHADRVAPSGNGWIHGSAAHTRIVVGANGQTYVGVWVEAPQITTTVERAPMALSLVIDTSGSMAGQKIEHARTAAAGMLETLADGDIVSLYAFSTDVVEILPPTPVNAQSRVSLNSQVSRLVASGGTNMYDGIRVGQARLSEAPATHPVRRLVVISDGHANIGPSDSASLGQLAAVGTEWGAQVTAIGVGLQYDENTLGALAVSSSGRMYHLRHPSEMATILQGELNLLAQTVATDVIIEIVPEPGIRILDTQSLGAQLSNNRIQVPIGNLHAGQRREVLFRAQVNTAQTGPVPVATANLSYRDPSGARQTHSQSAPVHVEVTRDANLAANSRAPEVQLMVANNQAAQAQRRGAELLNQGDNRAAQRQFEIAADTISGAVAAAPPEQQAPYRQREERLRSQSQAAGAANSAPARRSVALDSYEDALSAAGY